MNISSAVIILIVLFYVFLGFKRGVIKTGVSLVGTVAILIVSYVLKDILANFLMEHLPFFNFGGVFDGITSINDIIYSNICNIILFIKYFINSIRINRKVTKNDCYTCNTIKNIRSITWLN